MKKQIFTFWEPKNKIPAYIQLCIKTWYKFLPDYEIKILDYDNIKDYLDKKTLRKILCKKMTLPKQADCLRVALLYKYGGIWLDADTLITSNNFRQFLIGNKCSMIGTHKSVHLAFISTNKPKNPFITKWLISIKRRVKLFKIFSLSPVKHIFRKYYNKINNWDYVGNAVINPLLEKQKSNLHIIDKNFVNALPERNYNLNKNDSVIEQYQKFYFMSNSFIDLGKLLSSNKGIILLHNSWTPQKYKDMSKEEFLTTDTLLAKLLIKILNNKD